MVDTNTRLSSRPTPVPALDRERRRGRRSTTNEFFKTHTLKHSWDQSSIASGSLIPGFGSLPQSAGKGLCIDRFARQNGAHHQQFLQEYQIGRVVGYGAYAECREGWKIDDGKRVAFKVLRTAELQDDGMARYFEHEISVWQNLDHPHILPLLEYIELQGTMIAVMPLAERGNLLDYVSRKGRLEDGEARQLFKQLAQAVAYLHLEKGIVHRDIKLDNILLDASLNLYLSDFGLCDCIGQDCGFLSCTQPEEQQKGSIHYIPPESLHPCPPARMPLSELASYDMQSISHGAMLMKADIWALGVVLYAMVRGSFPFDDDFHPRLQLSILKGDYERLGEDHSPRLRNLLDGLLHSNVHQRLSIEQVLLHQWLREEEHAQDSL